MDMQVHSSGPTTDNYDNEGSAEASLADDIASWAVPIEQGANAQTLGDLLDELDAALDDPAKAAELESQGITREYVAQRREELGDIEKYDPDAFIELFQKLENISGQGSFDLSSSARLMLLEFNVAVAAEKIQVYQSNTDEQENANNAAQWIEDLAGTTSAGEEVTLTPEIVEALHESGLSPDDVSSPKLRAILSGEDPSTISFTSDELQSVADEVTLLTLEKTESTNTQLLLELQTAQNYRLEAYTWASNLEKKLHDEKMGMASKIGSA